MDVHQAKSASGQAVLIYKKEYFFIGYALNGGERVKEGENFFSSFQMAAGQFPNDHWVTDNFVLQQPFAEGVIAIAQMIHPYGCVHENHLGFSAPGNGPQASLRSTEAGKSFRARARNQGFQPHMNEGGFSLHTRQLSGLGEHVFFDNDGRSHAYQYAIFLCIRQGAAGWEMECIRFARLGWHVGAEEAGMCARGGQAASAKGCAVDLNGGCFCAILN